MRKPGQQWNRIRRIAAAVLAGVCSLGYAGAGVMSASEFSPADVAPQDVKRIAVLAYSFSSEYWGYVVQGCKAFDTADTTISVEVQSPSSSIAVGEQITMLKGDLDSGRYDGYLIAAISKADVEDILKDVDVPVVAMNTPIESSCVIGGIGTDNETAAAAGAKKAVEMAIDNGFEKPECVMIGGFEDDFNNEKRVTGFRRGVEENGGVWLDKVYPTDKSAEGAHDAMKAIMEEFPEGVAVVACYNDLLATNALEEAIENPAFENTVFLGFDGNGSVCDRIMNDDRYVNMVTVAQNPYEMGFHALELLSKHFFEMETQSTGDDVDGAADGAKDGAADRAEDGPDGAADGKSADSAADDTADSSEDGADKADDKAGAGEDSGGSEAQEDMFVNWIDSGYGVITKINAQERMLQIMSHLR